MTTSYKFRNIEEYLLTIYELIINNQNLLKYMYYLDNDPLSHANISQSVINNNIKDHILLTLFDINILTDEKVQLFLNPYKGNLRDRPSSDLLYRLDIVVPTDKWRLKGLGQLRAYRIADEFSQMVDGQAIAGVGNVVIFDFDAFKLSDKFSCLSLKFEVKSLSIVGLR